MKQPYDKPPYQTKPSRNEWLLPIIIAALVVLLVLARQSPEVRQWFNVLMSQMGFQAAAPNQQKISPAFSLAASDAGNAAASSLPAPLTAAPDAAPDAEPNVPWYAKRPTPDTLAKAQAGDAEAQFVVGRYFMHQDDWAAAVAWFEQAAAQGHAKAMSNAAIGYMEGKGVAKNAEKACRYFEQAHQQLHTVYSAENVAICNDNNGLRDFAKAAQFFEIAAQQGSAYSQRALGEMYAKGEGVPQSDKQATDWYRQAAANGNMEAAYALGVMYMKGKIATKNPNDAWFAAYLLMKTAQAHADAETMQKLNAIGFAHNLREWERHIPEPLKTRMGKWAQRASPADSIQFLQTEIGFESPAPLPEQGKPKPKKGNPKKKNVLKGVG